MAAKEKSKKQLHRVAENIGALSFELHGLHRTLAKGNQVRVQWASKLQDAGNLVLAGTVVAQMLEEPQNIRQDVAGVGLAIFIGSYLLAFGLMSMGGDNG